MGITQDGLVSQAGNMQLGASAVWTDGLLFDKISTVIKMGISEFGSNNLKEFGPLFLEDP